MAEQVNISKMPRVLFKEYVEDTLAKSGVKIVYDGFTTGVKKEVQAMVTQMEETYERPQLNSSSLLATLNITVEIFSEINDTGVHSAILKVMQINGSNTGLPTYRLKSITPTNSTTSYSNDSSVGIVAGTITLEIVYLM